MSQFEILSLLTSFCVTVLNCKVRRIKVATSWDYWEDSINLSMPIFSTVPGTFSLAAITVEQCRNFQDPHEWYSGRFNKKDIQG